MMMCTQSMHHKKFIINFNHEYKVILYFPYDLAVPLYTVPLQKRVHGFTAI